MAVDPDGDALVERGRRVVPRDELVVVDREDVPALEDGEPQEPVEGALLSRAERVRGGEVQADGRESGAQVDEGLDGGHEGEGGIEEAPSDEERRGPGHRHGDIDRDHVEPRVAVPVDAEVEIRRGQTTRLPFEGGRGERPRGERLQVHLAPLRVVQVQADPVRSVDPSARDRDSGEEELFGIPPRRQPELAARGADVRRERGVPEFHRPREAPVAVRVHCRVHGEIVKEAIPLVVTPPRDEGRDPPRGR